MKKRRLNPTYECTSAEWRGLEKEACFGAHFYAEACKHSRYKHSALETWLPLWFEECKKKGKERDALHMFDLFAGNGGYWTPHGDSAACSHPGTTACLCTAAASAQIPLHNVFASEKLKSFHSALKKVLVHHLSAENALIGGTADDAAASTACAATWAETNVPFTLRFFLRGLCVLTRVKWLVEDEAKPTNTSDRTAYHSCMPFSGVITTLLYTIIHHSIALHSRGGSMLPSVVC